VSHASLHAGLIVYNILLNGDVQQIKNTQRKLVINTSSYFVLRTVTLVLITSLAVRAQSV